MYPPLYSGALLVWMKLFGATLFSAMALHVVLFAIAGFFTATIVTRFFPASEGYGIVMLLLFGFTFDDRPESLAFVFGCGSLWLVARQISGGQFRAGTALGLALVLLLGLYTSVIVGAYFFDAGFLACACAWVWRRKLHWFAPFILAALLFALITFAIARMEPLWWAGFLENARQQQVLIAGFALPRGQSLLRLVRAMPVFLLCLAALPVVIARRKEMFSQESAWLALVTGIFVMGWVLLALCMTLLASNYVIYATFTQVILAAGLLALVKKHFPRRERLVRCVLTACVVLVSVRAIGMSTWGVACAWKNSYRSAQAVVQAELQPFTTSHQPVLVSSAFLYRAEEMGVRNAIHAAWYFDHANWKRDTQMDALIRLRPPKLVLTQFDYYRGLWEPLQQLRQHPDLVEIHVRDLSAVPVPDAYPSLQRIVQQISWAPVIVDLDWKKQTGS